MLQINQQVKHDKLLGVVRRIINQEEGIYLVRFKKPQNTKILLQNRRPHPQFVSESNYGYDYFFESELTSV